MVYAPHAARIAAKICRRRRGPAFAAAVTAWLSAAYAAAHAPPAAAIVQASVAMPLHQLSGSLPVAAPALGNMRQVRWREINF